jgi:hypothetical protein
LDEAIEVERTGINQGSSAPPQEFQKLARTRDLAGYRAWRHGSVISSMPNELPQQR